MRMLAAVEDVIAGKKQRVVTSHSTPMCSLQNREGQGDILRDPTTTPSRDRLVPSAELDDREKGQHRSMFRHM
jgi:hypothetical protein